MSRKSKFRLEDINELKMAMFIVRREFEAEVKKQCELNNGKIVSTLLGTGVSHVGLFEVLSNQQPSSVIFVAVRAEDAVELVRMVSAKCGLDKPGVGRGFLVDVDGYLGAKALFI